MPQKPSPLYRDLVAQVLGAIPSLDVPAHVHVPAHVSVASLRDLRALAVRCEDEIIDSEKPRASMMRGAQRRRRDPEQRPALRWKKYGSAGDVDYYYRADASEGGLVVCTLHVARVRVRVHPARYVWNVSIIDTHGRARLDVPRGEWLTLTRAQDEAGRELARITERNTRPLTARTNARAREPYAGDLDRQLDGERG